MIYIYILIIYKTIIIQNGFIIIEIKCKIVIIIKKFIKSIYNIENQRLKKNKKTNTTYLWIVDYYFAIA